MPDLSIENKKRQLNFNAIAGVDEAGRGALAGPVVAIGEIVTRQSSPRHFCLHSLN